MTRRWIGLAAAGAGLLAAGCAATPSNGETHDYYLWAFEGVETADTIMASEQARAILDAPHGDTRAWTTPETGNRGLTTVADAPPRDGRACRTVLTRMQIAETGKEIPPQTVLYCQAPNGSWALQN